MNRGLIVKAVREIWLPVVLLALALAGVEAVLALIVPQLDAQFIEQWLKIGFIKTLLTSLFGSEIGDSLGPRMLTAFIWVHPMLLTLTWALAILLGTRLPAGEVDRGTIDVLLGLPVSRWRLYLCESLALLTCGVLVIAIGLLGHLIGRGDAEPASRLTALELLRVNLNLFCLYSAVGGIALFVSSLSERRGRTIGVVIAVVLASFLLNSLVPWWKVAKAMSFLSLLDYYRPLAILRDHVWPMTDIAVLLAAGGLFWLAGAVVMSRRDLCTV